MSDIVDMAAEIEGEHRASGVRRARVPIPAGAAGDCEECGHYMLRLVDGRCGFCRDGRLPPDNWEPPVRPRTMPLRKKTMAIKSIQLPAFATAAVQAVENHAKREEKTFGAAAAELIELGYAARNSVPAGDAAPGVGLNAIHMDALLDEVRRRCENAANAEELADAIQRADAAEAKLTSLREALGA